MCPPGIVAAISAALTSYRWASCDHVDFLVIPLIIHGWLRSLLSPVGTLLAGQELIEITPLYQGLDLIPELEHSSVVWTVSRWKRQYLLESLFRK